jgi:hypothetical protein
MLDRACGICDPDVSCSGWGTQVGRDGLWVVCLACAWTPAALRRVRCAGVLRVAAVQLHRECCRLLVCVVRLARQRWRQGFAFSGRREGRCPDHCAGAGRHSEVIAVLVLLLDKPGLIDHFALFFSRSYLVFETDVAGRWWEMEWGGKWGCYTLQLTPS